MSGRAPVMKRGLGLGMAVDFADAEIYCNILTF